MDLWNDTTERLIDVMTGAGIRRAYLVTDPDTGGLRASHPLLDPLADALRRDTRDYHGHEGSFFELGRESGHLLGAFVHMTRRGAGSGGVRFWTYPTVEQYVRDGLRLSRGMGHKCALAGLWWGGGKGVIARRPGRDHLDRTLRDAIYRDYGRFVSSLAGCYVVAEDVGTTTTDMAAIFTQTRHATCIPEELGGSGNPSILTATGVVVAMEAALEHLGLGTLEGKTIAMQGLGNVATYMIGDLLQRRVGRILGADIDATSVARVKERFPGAPLDLRTVAMDSTAILAEPCDILAPNATGAILNPHTIPHLRAAVVCGAANNQLEDLERDGPAIRDRGILYVPDFLANRMGIVNAANEQYGYFPNDPAIYRHLSREAPEGVFLRAMEVFRRAKEPGRTTAKEAELLADELALKLHPIWGHRGQVIINHLVKSGWDKQ